MHGGNAGWHRKVWEAKEVENGVEFRYTSKDGDDKYPGEVAAKVVYKLVGNELSMSMSAKMGDQKMTPIGLTNHSYFNLAGHKAEEGILKNVL